MGACCGESRPLERTLASIRANRREAARLILSAPLASFAMSKMVDKPSSRDMVYKRSFQSVRNRIEKAIARGDATGVAVAVVQGGRIVWEEGFGWANRDSNRKVTARTPFGMASITKPFTATTIMTLVATGKLSLYEPANQYLLDSKIIGTKADATSVRLLGAHVSGLPGIFESYNADEAKFVPSPDALIREYGRLAYPPITCYEYSNIGYAALHAIASAVTRTEFGPLMHRRVLAPLGLNDSFFGSDTARFNAAATRYDPVGRAIPHYTTSTPASGELHASVHDLARFALFNMKHRVEGQAAILNERHIDELHQPVFIGPSGIATTFGWFKGHTVSGTPFLFKGGGDPGVANLMCIVPSKQFACIAVTNQSKAWDLAHSVCDELLTNVLPDWKRPEEYCGYPSTLFVASPAFRGRWQGTLENDGASMRAELSIDSDKAATLSIGANRAEQITGMQMEGEAFRGTSTGQIDSPDARRTGAHTLQIKLLLHDKQLVGRVLAEAGDPNVHNARLPYVLTLKRMV